LLATLLVGGQLAGEQQFPLVMQLLLQANSPLGQLQLPPGPEHVSPATVQSLLLQQLEIGMHPVPGHDLSPAGQLHEPPGPEHVAGGVQSLLVQQAPCGMHWLNEPFVQTVPPLEHVQFPPGPVHVCPPTRQSLLLQHVLLGMQELLAAHTLLFAPQLQVPPGVGHVEPVMPLPSVSVQQLPLAMHEFVATHAQ
jgi:hypothetical protein